MISPQDPFAAAFDSIRLDPVKQVRAPDCLADFAADFSADPASGAPREFLFAEDALPEATKPDGPGFYLLDDADGRFTIDHETGVVTLAHDHLLSLEAGAVHPVHIKVIEQSGAAYDLNFRLRISGRVPQIAGSHDNDALAALAAPPLLDLMAPAETAPATALACAWSVFAAVGDLRAAARLGPEHAAFGALIDAPAPSGVDAAPAQLGLAAPPPAPAPAAADWRL